MSQLEFCILGSGSAGNSTVVRSGQTTILVDAGLSAKQLVLRLESVGINPDKLDGIVLTHEHGDHTRGIDVFCRKRALPIFCNIRTREVLRSKIQSEVSWRLFESGDVFPVGDLKVQSFYIPHDAVEPMGFKFQHRTGTFGLVSDVGHVTTLVKDHLRGVDSLFVEANYDELMLQNDTKRPWSTKQRISSRHGHLSNDQACELVLEIACDRLRHVVLGHLSRDCNCPEVAAGLIKKKLGAAGFPDVHVRCAEQNVVLPFQSVTSRELAKFVPQPVEAESEVENHHAEPKTSSPADRTDRELSPEPVRLPEVQPWTATQPSLFEF